MRKGGDEVLGHLMRYRRAELGVKDGVEELFGSALEAEREGVLGDAEAWVEEGVKRTPTI